MLQNDQALLRYLAGNFSPMLVINKRILDVQVFTFLVLQGEEGNKL